MAIDGNLNLRRTLQKMPSFVEIAHIQNIELKFYNFILPSTNYFQVLVERLTAQENAW
jgi:hypothetical protein